jgi:IS1 family transposase
VYEVDEIQTYIGRNHPSCYKYITYALNRTTKLIIDFIVGSRTKENIRKVTEKVLALTPRKIYTDGLNIYPSLIPAAIHRNFQYRTNTSERNNLTIRNSLKRLSRKTICFSKNILMLEACMRILFWGCFFSVYHGSCPSGVITKFRS